MVHLDCILLNARLCYLFFALYLVLELLLNMLRKTYLADHLSFVQALLEIKNLCKYYKIDSFLKHILQTILMLDLQEPDNFQILFKALCHKDFIILILYFLVWSHITNNQKIYPS